MTEEVIDRVLNGRDAFAAHKAAGAAAAAAVGCGAPDAAALAEACAERLLGQALQGLAKDVLFAAAQMPKTRQEQQESETEETSEASEAVEAPLDAEEESVEEDVTPSESDSAAVEALAGLDEALDVRDPGDM